MGSKRFKYSRYAMYTKIEGFFKEYKPKVGKCLLVGDTLKGGKGNSALTDMLPKGSEIVAPDYPGVDMQDMPYEDNMFDYVIADQVIEHVRKPWVGVEEVRRVLKPKGLAILTSALIFYMHGVPEDYWRFTPDGLSVLCEKFSVIHRCEGTGNLNFVIDVLKGINHGVVTPGTELAKKAMACDDKNLVSVWVVAEK